MLFERAVRAAPVSRAHLLDGFCQLPTRFFPCRHRAQAQHGREQTPGGWNRLALEVKDLPARIEELKKAGLHFRNEMLDGPGGKQIQLEDPDGNPIELFEWAEQAKIAAS